MQQTPMHRYIHTSCRLLSLPLSFSHIHPPTLFPRAIPMCAVTRMPLDPCTLTLHRHVRRPRARAVLLTGRRPSYCELRPRYLCPTCGWHPCTQDFSSCLSFCRLFCKPQRHFSYCRYSFGITMYEMLSRQIPFRNMDRHVVQ